MNKSPIKTARENILTSFLSSEDGHFIVDTLRNVIWFVLIALSALGLQLIVQWAEGNGASNFIVLILTGAEYALLVADVIWFLSRLGVTTYLAIMNTFSQLNKNKSVTTQSSSTHSTSHPKSVD